MLSKSKQRKLLAALKAYHKQYLSKSRTDLDESGTRLMINFFLTEVLNYAPIEEVKTEYMIKGTYADYVIQLKKVQHFLVEVKKMGIELSDKHLRQAIQYGANEGIEWALLTNGKQFDFYKIFFERPLREVKVFSIDLSDSSKLKMNAEMIQFLHRDSVAGKGLGLLWNKCLALEPTTVAALLKNKTVVNFLKRTLRVKYKHKLSDEEIITSLNRVIYESIQLSDVKNIKVRKGKSRKTRGGPKVEIAIQQPSVLAN